LRYLISGYYGEGNAGDEAILAGMLQEISRRDRDAAFTVLSFSPEDTLRRHASLESDAPRDPHGAATEGASLGSDAPPGWYIGPDSVSHPLEVMSTSLRAPRRLRAALATTDLAISGGGSFLHEADFELHGRSFLLREGKLRPIPYFLSIVLLARAAGVPVMWYAQGLGPLHTRTAKRLVARAGSMSQAVTWRDRASAELAERIGVRAPLQAIVPDPAYGLRPAPASDIAGLLAKAGLSERRRYLVLCPRPWLGRTAYLKNLGEALEKALAALDMDLVLVPFHETLDPPVCETVAARPGFAGRAHILAPPRSPAQLAAILGAAELVIAMRLHSGILSAAAGTPAVVLDYDPKTDAFAQQTRQTQWAVSVDDLETAAGAGALLAAILGSVEDLPRRRRLLEQAVAPLRAEAGHTAQLAVQLAASATRGVSR